MPCSTEKAVSLSKSGVGWWWFFRMSFIRLRKFLLILERLPLPFFFFYHQCMLELCQTSFLTVQSLCEFPVGNHIGSFKKTNNSAPSTLNSHQGSYHWAAELKGEPCRWSLIFPFSGKVSSLMLFLTTFRHFCTCRVQSTAQGDLQPLLKFFLSVRFLESATRKKHRRTGFISSPSKRSPSSRAVTHALLSVPYISISHSLCWNSPVLLIMRRLNVKSSCSNSWW